MHLDFIDINNGKKIRRIKSKTEEEKLFEQIERYNQVEELQMFVSEIKSGFSDSKGKEPKGKKDLQKDIKNIKVNNSLSYQQKQPNNNSKSDGQLNKIKLQQQEAVSKNAIKNELNSYDKNQEFNLQHNSGSILQNKEMLGHRNEQNSDKELDEDRSRGANDSYEDDSDWDDEFFDGALENSNPDADNSNYMEDFDYDNAVNNHNFSEGDQNIIVNNIDDENGINENNQKENSNLPDYKNKISFDEIDYDRDYGEENKA